MENNEIQISKYSGNSITINDFNQMILSFQNNQILNNDQKAFIKQLYIWGEIEYEKVLGGIGDPCYITSIPLESNSKHYYYDILNLIATDSIDMVYNKGLNINLTHQDIKKIYFNLLNKIKQCYEENIITKDKYLYILGELLYVNTARIFYKLGRNSVQIKNHHLNNITPLYTLFFDSLKKMDKDLFALQDDKLFNYGSINELKDSYELYKSVMKQIINDILTVLALDSNAIIYSAS